MKRVHLLKHELGGCETLLALYRQLGTPIADLGILDFLHDGAVEEGAFVARVEEGRGCDGPYEACAPAA